MRGCLLSGEAGEPLRNTHVPTWRGVHVATTSFSIVYGEVATDLDTRTIAVTSALHATTGWT
jgi:hypothetical protein